jgi:hypothetical protein
MIKKQLMVGALLFLIVQMPLSAFNAYIGIRGEGGITRGYGDIGLYRFNGTFRGTNPPVQAIRSTNQMAQFYGSVGVFAQLEFLPWYALVPELSVSFNRGLSYSGNYDSSTIIPINEEFPELTGEMRYSWMSLTFAIMNQFTVVKPLENVSFHLLAGAVSTVTLGSVREEFRPDFAGSNTPGSPPGNQPYPGPNTRRFAPQKSLRHWFECRLW